MRCSCFQRFFTIVRTQITHHHHHHVLSGSCQQIYSPLIARSYSPLQLLYFFFAASIASTLFVYTLPSMTMMTGLRTPPQPDFWIVARVVVVVVYTCWVLEDWCWSSRFAVHIWVSCNLWQARKKHKRSKVKNRNYALTYLNTIATIFPVHITQANKLFLRGWVVGSMYLRNVIFQH